MSIENVQPYVVSRDIKGLLRRWSGQSGYLIPKENYLDGLSRELHSYLTNIFGAVVEMVSEKEIQRGLNELVRNSKLPVVSLDRAYTTAGGNIVGFIDVTRAVNPQLQSLGLQPRPGFPSIEQQLESIRELGFPRICLVDDVIFSGLDLRDTIIPGLKKLGISVVSIYTGIGIGNGIELLRSMDIQVKCVREYSGVIDVICERDFFAGVPLSGRTVINGRENWSAPYFLPFGDPVRWASLPEEKKLEFSDFCLGVSAELWEKVERLSEKPITLRSLPRRLPNKNQGLEVTKFLKEIKSGLNR